MIMLTSSMVWNQLVLNSCCAVYFPADVLHVNAVWTTPSATFWVYSIQSAFHCHKKCWTECNLTRVKVEASKLWNYAEGSVSSQVPAPLWESWCELPGKMTNLGNFQTHFTERFIHKNEELPAWAVKKKKKKDLEGRLNPCWFTPYILILRDWRNVFFDLAMEGLNGNWLWQYRIQRRNCEWSFRLNPCAHKKHTIVMYYFFQSEKALSLSDVLMVFWY